MQEASSKQQDTGKAGSLRTEREEETGFLQSKWNQALSLEKPGFCGGQKSKVQNVCCGHFRKVG
jgi:hypothetical protein